MNEKCESCINYQDDPCITCLNYSCYVDKDKVKRMRNKRKRLREEIYQMGEEEE